MISDVYDAYWVECIEIAFDEHGVIATEEQIKAVAGDVQGGHENYGMSFPSPTGPSPVQRELDETKAALKEERGKVICRQCNGNGRIYIQGPYHSSDSECSKCRGEGRHA